MVARRGRGGASAIQWVDDVGETPVHRRIGRNVKAAKGPGEVPNQRLSRRGGAGGGERGLVQNTTASDLVARENVPLSNADVQ